MDGISPTIVHRKLSRLHVVVVLKLCTSCVYHHTLIAIYRVGLIRLT